MTVADVLQLVGGIVLSAGFALLFPWLGIVALGAFLILFGLAKEL